MTHQTNQPITESTVGDHYKEVATGQKPALLIYIIDISGSMSEAFEDSTKIDYVNRALQSLLKRMVRRSTRGEIISARYRLAMAAYSDTVVDMLGGVQDITQVAARGNPVLSPTNTTETASAFSWARDILRAELPNMQGKPAPMVCHLTDGVFTGPDPEPIAQEIMQMSNDDGHVLIENIFVGPGLTTNGIGDVERWRGIQNPADLKSPYAKKLYDMSSPLPASYAEEIAREGYDLQAGSRMLIPGSDSNLIELAFTMSGATPAS
jgi:hypothetical protein